MEAARESFKRFALLKGGVWWYAYVSSADMMPGSSTTRTN